jgi:hypothetical protein
MSYAYRWVEPPWSDKVLPRAELEDRIQHLLAETNICVLATVARDGSPMASPIEYYADGMELYVLPDRGTPKLKAMARDHRISAAVHREYHGWHSGHGLQLFGRVELIEPNAPGWDHAMKVFRWHGWASDLGLDTSKPFETNPIARIIPDRIIYIESWLWKQGFAAKQIWRRDS